MPQPSTLKHIAFLRARAAAKTRALDK